MERARLDDLPPSMAERAKRARQIACKDPDAVENDEEFLPWVWDYQSKLWLSFDGNYSEISPTMKWLKARERQRKQEEWEEQSNIRIQQRFELQMLWSKMRAAVLERDNYTCQLCFHVETTPLHVHHILKRIEGGTDHLDNLLTVCNTCHKRADTKLYDPDWSRPPEMEPLAS